MATEIELGTRHGPFPGALDAGLIAQYAAATNDTIAAATDAPWPYEGTAVDDPPLGVVRLLPYHRWARRGPATMRVWLPTVQSPRARSSDG